MNYTRVIPRDFFNEAKLLKCMGQLALKVHDELIPNNIDIKVKHDGTPFNIFLLKGGSLMIINVFVIINGEYVKMKTTYNSKSNYPLFCELDDEETLVFTEEGEFTEEFIERFKV